MLRTILPLALSVSVLALSATPALAQMRRSASPAPAAPAAPATEASHPGLTLRVFIGPAFEGGNRRAWTTRQRSTVSTPAAAPAGATFTSTSSASSTVDEAAFGDGMGVMYGLEGTWWGSDRLGLGGSLFGAYLGAGTSASILPPSPLPTNQTVGANTVAVTDVTTVTTGFGPTHTVTLTPTPVGGGVAGLTYAGWSGIPGAGGTTFALRSGTETGANPDTYSSVGGVAYSSGRTLWLNEIGLQGEYRVIEAPAGGVSFFGGFTVPTAGLSQTFTAKTVGANGSGTVASETQNVDQGGGATYTQRTEYEFSESMKLDGSFLAAGPVIGLNAFYSLNRAARLYTRIGYAPVLVGTATTNVVTTVNNRRSVIIENLAGNPAGVAAGTQRWETQSTTPVANVAAFTGSETMGTIGLGFGLAGFNLFAEGVARSYTMTAPMGPELIYGLNLGVNAGF